jgi:hypothetical protein
MFPENIQKSVIAEATQDFATKRKLKESLLSLSLSLSLWLVTERA